MEHEDEKKIKIVKSVKVSGKIKIRIEKNWTPKKLQN